MSVHKYIDKVMKSTMQSTPGQTEFYQAVEEVLVTLEPILKAEPKYDQQNILERIVIPERQIIFRVTWMDDAGKIQTNIGYRVQFNSAIGPYKGGLRFHPSVNLGIVKFLGFEQIFKNSLTGLPIGGGKGGSNFDPKGKSDGEIMRFCQSFMLELSKYIGETRDVPAGDIGVGGREIGYMFGEYKRLTGNFEGILTGKGLNWGGSLARTEATGFGSVYFAENILNKQKDSLEGKIAAVSGSGNVAIYTIQKLYDMGAKAVTCSDSRGMIYDKNGIDLDTLKLIKETRRDSLEEYVLIRKNATYLPVHSYPEGTNAVWGVPCDVAFPSATQNELNLADMKNLHKNGCKLVCEGANMPTTPDAIEYMLANKMMFGPAKAANAGGVATSQLEMSQNASMSKWSFADVDSKLRTIMKSIFDLSYDTSKEFGDEGNIMMGANIAGFRKVADSMIDQGAV
ncbi:MAG TPA: NADP-specific glutamate dehydrogenase [Sulfurospirillum arcachonense]|nr:NADP-specific glutamate dehydrogenase [Sulfurospirillum arcachonense]HIP45537.1 NADP-specific glutamate dehydrogenase [Sulfurospirillum arcachonense]